MLKQTSRKRTSRAKADPPPAAKDDKIAVVRASEPQMTTKEWFALLDSFNDEPFMPNGREQPAMPPDRTTFD